MTGVTLTWLGQAGFVLRGDAPDAPVPLPAVTQATVLLTR
jgi:hypothetical protein